MHSIWLQRDEAAVQQEPWEKTAKERKVCPQKRQVDGEPWPWMHFHGIPVGVNGLL